jgi:hypothetical protein
VEVLLGEIPEGLDIERGWIRLIYLDWLRLFRVMRWLEIRPRKNQADSSVGSWKRPMDASFAGPNSPFKQKG